MKQGFIAYERIGCSILNQQLLTQISGPAVEFFFSHLTDEEIAKFESGELTLDQCAEMVRQSVKRTEK